MESPTLLSQNGILDRQQLALVPTPEGTATHRPIPHHEVVNALVETLGFRHIGVVSERYAVSKDGMKMFGVIDLDTAEHDFRFSVGIRNARCRGKACHLPRVRGGGARHPTPPRPRRARPVF